MNETCFLDGGVGDHAAAKKKTRNIWLQMLELT